MFTLDIKKSPKTFLTWGIYLNTLAAGWLISPTASYAQAGTSTQEITISPATQGPQTQIINFVVKKGSLASALQSLQKQTNIHFIYDVNDLKGAQVEATEFKNETVSTILKALVKKNALTFEEKQGMFILKPAVRQAPSTNTGTEKQKQDIRGKITEETTGEALVGANITVKGQSRGTITDVDGNFSLKEVEETDVLVISMIGYLSEEVPVGTRNTIDVQLIADIKTLQDVVVIGYGELTKKEVTSSIATVSPKEFNKGVVGTPDQLLQGKVAGLNITRNGDPNGAASVILRGASTLRTGEAQEAFYVIDGVPGASINLVPPDDIVSIDVLKDASATAIYGSRAANGVIMITTRRQKPAYGISYNGYVGVEEVSNRIEMLSGDELREYLQKNGKSLAPADDDKVNTDWQKEVMRTAISHNHNLSYGGGTDKASFNASVNYFKKEGVMKNSDSERLIGKLHLEQKAFNDKLKMNFALTNSILKQNVIPGLVLRNMLTYLPTVNVTNADGSFKENLTRTQYYNPLALSEQNKEDKKTNTLLANAQVQVDILKNLSYNLSASLQTESTQGGSYQDSHSPLPIATSWGSTITGMAAGGLAKRYSYSTTKKLLENYLTYQPFNTKIHVLKILAGYSWQQDEKGDGFQATNQGFISDALGYNNLSLGSSGTRVDYGNGGISTLRLISFYSRINYNLLDKYFLQISVRQDGSSAFGKNNKWGTFPAASLAWNIAGESFMANQSLFSALKLRGGYGITGNSLGFDPLISILRYTNGGAFYYNGKYINSVGPGQNENPDLKWESTGMLNVGLDFELWKGRIGGTIEYYDKSTSDLIFDYEVSTTQKVYGIFTANVGKISNKGVELTLNATPLQLNHFRWDVTGTFSHNKNKVQKLDNEQFKKDKVYLGNPDGLGQSGIYTQIIQTGYPMGQFYTAHYAGRDEKGNSLFSKADGTTTTDPKQPTDFQYAGNAQPVFFYGVSNSLSWKNWDFNFFLRGVYGNKIMNATLANLNVPSQAALTNIPKFSLNEPFADTRSNWYSDRYIENGSYLRLDNVTLGYTLPIKNEYLKRFRIYATSQNLFTITQYRGIDPEVSLGGRTPGLDNNNFYPKTKTYLVGLNIEF